MRWLEAKTAMESPLNSPNLRSTYTTCLYQYSDLPASFFDDKNARSMVESWLLTAIVCGESKFDDESCFAYSSSLSADSLYSSSLSVTFVRSRAMFFSFAKALTVLMYVSKRPTYADAHSGSTAAQHQKVIHYSKISGSLSIEKILTLIRKFEGNGTPHFTQCFSMSTPSTSKSLHPIN